MIENANASKVPSSGEYVDIPKYIGVASINVLAINPNNDKLRKYGWTVPEGAEEPNYVIEKMGDDGKITKNARVRFLVQIQELEDKPVVALDFWVRPEISANKDNTKFKIIDAFGRTAWATKDEIKNKEVPLYSSGMRANIATPYRLCHSGEEELVGFMLKYLNVTPLQIFDRAKQSWTATKNPGKLTIDNWDALCTGNIRELAEYCALQPDNRVKVVLGVRSTDDNKSYQTFLNTGYLGNGSVPDRGTGEYASARRLIDKFFENRSDSPYSFSAEPVKEWKMTATEVKDNYDDVFGGQSTTEDNPDDDLPFF